MIRRLKYILTAFVMAHAFMAGAKAAPLNKDAVAVIIGNKDYKSRIPTVDFAHNDADAFKAFVIDVLGFDPENIIDLRDASKAQLETAFGNRETHEGKLWRYISPKGKSDVVVFYSGHGVPGLKDKRGYILPVDADAETPEINGFPVDTLLANLGKLKTKSMTVFLDACFSGDSQGGRLVRSTSGITISPKLPSSSSSMTIITAAQGDQVASWDLKAKHGMFTKHLLDALRGGADKASYGNGDKKVSLGEVREYLDDRLTRAARRQFGRHQNAWARGDNGAILASVVSTPRRIVKPISIREMDATYVAVKTANLRAAPSTSSEIIGSISSGNAVEVRGRVVGSNWFVLEDKSFIFGDLVKPKTDTEFAFWHKIKDSTNSNDFETHLAHFPNGKFSDDARQRIYQLSFNKVFSSLPKLLKESENDHTSDKVLPNGTVREKYDFAYGLLRRLQMSEAEVALKEFILDHSSHRLVHNARYWLGEAYFSRRNYELAAATFLESYSKSPKGPKARDNLYKLGKSLSRMGKKGNACKVWNTLLTTFNNPADQPMRQRTQVSFDGLNCSTLKNHTNRTTSPNTHSKFAQPLTVSEVDAVRDKMETCWSVPSTARDAKNFIVRIQFALNPDGSFRGKPRIVDQSDEVKNKAFYKIFSAAALRAVQKCAPYDMLPRAKYKRWQDMVMTFDPQEMAGK
jgi:tol-pal system protein YbgF